MATQITAYPFPRIMPRSAACTLSVNGAPISVLHTEVADFAAFECDGPAEVVIEIVAPHPGQITVHPLARGIVASRDAHRAAINLPGPMNLMIQIPDQIPLMLYANPPEVDRPAEGPDVLFFRAGQVYEVGELRLSAGQTLYVEGGAVVRGSIRATQADGVRLRGRGVIDGSYYTSGIDGRHTIEIEKSNGVRIDDLIVIQPTTWMTVLGACNDVQVRNLREIGQCCGSDGIDIVGSSNVLIDGCCLKNNDDCIVIKSLDARGPGRTARHSWEGDVRNVLVQNCVFMNDRYGNVLEIGHELRTPEVRGITFRNCDLLHCHTNGAPLSIHAGDRAVVRDILFEDLRIEHYWDKLLDIRVMKSVFNYDKERGQIRNITFRNIHVTAMPMNAGYSTSLIGGWDEQHTVQDVIFDRFYMNDRLVQSVDELDIHTRHAHGIRFV